MSPIPLGIWATAGAGASGGGPAYEYITAVSLGSNQASVTFDVSSYLSTYKHLQIRMTAVSTYESGNWNQFGIRFNSDTAANYKGHFLRGTGSGVASAAYDLGTYAVGGYIGTQTNSFSIHGSSVIDILDFANTSKYTTFKSITGVMAYSSPYYAGVHSGLWLNTSAVTSITLLPVFSSNFRADSRFRIFGIKG